MSNSLFNQFCVAVDEISAAEGRLLKAFAIKIMCGMDEPCPTDDAIKELRGRVVCARDGVKRMYQELLHGDVGNLAEQVHSLQEEIVTLRETLDRVLVRESALKETLRITENRAARLAEAEKAITVLVETPHIKDYLARHDPKALEQGRLALL